MKKKLVLSIVIAMLSVICLYVSASAEGAALSLSGPSELKAGDTFDVTFALSGEDILGINGELTYDSSLVTLTGMESSAVSQWTSEFNGGVFLAYDSSLSLPISSETLLFTANFEVNADAWLDL